jgi:hypothetical protein
MTAEVALRRSNDAEEGGSALNPQDEGDARLALVGAAVHERRPVGLDDLLEVACLDTRVDRKYLVPLAKLPTLLDSLPDQLLALDIEGRRVFLYDSVYFDSEDFALYHQHVQGRRKRYKARTRSYCDTFESMLEVKYKGRRGQTVKERRPHDFSAREVLTPEGLHFVNTVIGEAYGNTAPSLRMSLRTGYHRATLVDVEHASRLTIDINLTWADDRSSHQSGEVALIESKSVSGLAPVDLLVASLGVRPVHVSKYCLGVALLHPGIAANPWSRVLRRQFGWQRSPETI